MTATAPEPPLVSIIITAYNDEATVAEAIESALGQDHPRCEVIVVLDGPGDRTPWMVAPYADRVTILRKENGGTASARNRGLDVARGRWVQLLDADDALLPGKVSTALAALERSPLREDIAVIYSGYYRVNAATGELVATHYAEPYSREKLLTVPAHVTTNPLIRRDVLEAVGRYSGAYRYAEDTELYHRIGLHHPMLAVPEPLFVYRVHPGQKTRVMRNHPSGDLVAEEPRRIHKTYARPFARVTPPWMHPTGKLSRRGVLDVGLKCTHSCKFCYYSFLDGSDDQFGGMRRADFRSTADCKTILRRFADAGLTHYDVTGGEPTLHPDIVELVRYARHELGLRGRIITLGQFLGRRFRKRPRPLLDELIDAGLDDLLLSVHAVDPEIFAEVTGERYERLAAVMDTLDARGFSYTTNTLVYRRNVEHLPRIAEALAGRRVRIANFIVMNTYHRWNEGGRVLGIQARYREIRPYLAHAVETLEEAGVGVNIRYGPLCAYKGLEPHFVGVLGVELDPYEWRSTLRTGEIKAHRSEEDYLATQRRMLDDPSSMYTKCFGPSCAACRMRLICDGVDRKYVAQYGWSEFRPYPMAPGQGMVTDAVAFRRQNPRVFRLKHEGPDRPALDGGLDVREVLLLADGRWDDEVAELVEAGRIDDAVSHLERARAAEPEALGAWLQLATILRHRGEAEALARLEAELTARPGVGAHEVIQLRWAGRGPALARLPAPPDLGNPAPAAAA